MDKGKRFMIIVQTPLRVSLFGGGTDFPPYFMAEGGCVLSFAIDKFIFVSIKRRFDEMLRLGWTRTEMVSSIDEIQHELVREALRKTGIKAGVEITTMGDIPSEGSGLGSSSTVTVGALHAMYTYLGDLVSAGQLAREACEIEIDILGKPIGIQDQYIAAYGGLRFMEFGTDGKVQIQKIDLDTELLPASRAVGAANGRNPLPIVIPCHRVIGQDGSLTGYGGGLRFKKALLALEKTGRIEVEEQLTLLI
jgi:D-glycero-alpha-D-manno-heptose-7-phosphate kinase